MKYLRFSLYRRGYWMGLIFLFTPQVYAVERSTTTMADECLSHFLSKEYFKLPSLCDYYLNGLVDGLLGNKANEESTKQASASSFQQRALRTRLGSDPIIEKRQICLPSEADRSELIRLLTTQVDKPDNPSLSLDELLYNRLQQVYPC